MAYSHIGSLVYDLLECFVKKENEQIDKSTILNEKIRKKLKTDFKNELSPELKIQMGEEYDEPELIEPIKTLTPLEEIEDIYNQEKEDFLKIALTVNKTDLETAVDMVEDSNKALFN